MTRTVALDPGYGNIKVFGINGSLVMPSVVAVPTAASVQRMEGLRTTRRPARVESEKGTFYVGQGAHDWGKPVENLDFDRLTGAPEMLALVLGAMARHEAPREPINLLVGLPIASLMGDQASSTRSKVREFLTGTHVFRVDDRDHVLTVAGIQITSQPVGAMFDFLLDDDGRMPTHRQAEFRGEIGVLSIGMNTLEMLVVRDRAPVQRFIAAEPLGVRRLLELTRESRRYSLMELDARLRKNQLDIDLALPIWRSEVLGFFERYWGSSFRRFNTVVAVGGGAKILRQALYERFGAIIHMPSDPIIATARGLYKYSVSRSRRRE